MLLEHYAEKPVVRVGRRSQKPETVKPNGLWVSVAGDNDWPWWCRGEGYRVERLALRHVVVLKPNARVLTIASAAAIDDFHAEYVGEHRFGWPDWVRVATAFDGIVIAPYQWSRRLMRPASGWYYGWDCASGCIWNPRAVASIELANEPVGVAA